MPQMMPLMWLTLLLFFTTVFILFNVMNYFIHIPMNASKEKNMLLKKSIKWLW
uniref:ATP synthase F0 subunit 8 n=1 Tax=Sorineuchora bivitta TaxID=1928793 RepID=UPI0027A52BFA|nr:ATP synthase F0 subunit 8 [Sorineuchora bivitta]WGO57746.1 ATP synthase F0 subunit 8 [Sorineuchora bivitta]